MKSEKEVFESPKDQWEAVNKYVKACGHLRAAIVIMESCLENNDQESQEFHQKRMKEFLQKFSE